jgi:hypothetical protein
MLAGNANVLMGGFRSADPEIGVPGWSPTQICIQQEGSIAEMNF